MAAKRKSAKPARAAVGNIQTRMIETVHQIWLAGLGAASKAQQGAPKLLEELVEEGERVDARLRSTATRTVREVFGNLQDSLGARVSDVRGQASDAVDSLEKMFRTRVHRALTQLGVPSAEEIAALSKRVDTLNANIGKIGRIGRTGRTGRPPRARKAPGRARAHAVTRMHSTSAAAP